MRPHGINSTATITVRSGGAATLTFATPCKSIWMGSPPTPLVPHAMYAVKIPGKVTRLYVLNRPPIVGLFRFGFVGDMGWGNKAQKDVLAGAQSFCGKTGKPMDLAMFGGDNAYWEGTMLQYDKNFFAQMPGLLLNTTILPIIGNHDAYGDGAATFLKLFCAPKRFTHGVKSGSCRYYSTTLGMVHLLVLDSFTSSLSRTGAQAKWIVNDIAAARAKGVRWIVATSHYPPFACPQPKCMEIHNNIYPLLETAAVDLFLVAHIHNYQRVAVTRCKTVTVIVGAGGADHRPPPSIVAPIVKGTTSLSSLVCDVVYDSFTCHLIGAGVGVVLDTFVLRK